jgi:hypothetical protein
LAEPLQQQAEKKRRHDKENDVSCNSQLYVLFTRQIYAIVHRVAKSDALQTTSL